MNRFIQLKWYKKENTFLHTYTDAVVVLVYLQLVSFTDYDNGRRIVTTVIAIAFEKLVRYDIKQRCLCMRMISISFQWFSFFEWSSFMRQITLIQELIHRVFWVLRWYTCDFIDNLTSFTHVPITDESCCFWSTCIIPCIAIVRYKNTNTSSLRSRNAGFPLPCSTPSWFTAIWTTKCFGGIKWQDKWQKTQESVQHSIGLGPSSTWKYVTYVVSKQLRLWSWVGESANQSW